MLNFNIPSGIQKILYEETTIFFLPNDFFVNSKHCFFLIGVKLYTPEKNLLILTEMQTPLRDIL